MAGKVVVTGGTGFIGRALCDRLEKEGRSVVVLSRSAPAAAGARRQVAWNPSDPDGAAAAAAPEFSGAEGVVNLAGAPLVGKRWTAAWKDEILRSRLRSTRAVVGALAKASPRPAVLVNASAVGYYGPRGDDELGEDASPGRGFLAEVCRGWEEEALKARALGVRVVTLRIGVVLGRGGGALRAMLPPFKLGLGGPLGSGRQWMSWIHLDDATGLALWALRSPRASGAVNGASPEPATNEDFSRALARVLRRPCLFRVPAFALKLAIGEMGSVLLEGQRVVPRKALEGGYAFRQPALEGALRDLLSPKSA